MTLRIHDHFDAVVMLTWSDWATEPRSNRYHYATRFAQHVPVLFLQHRYLPRNGIEVVPSGFPGIDLVDVSCGIECDDARQVRRLLAARGIRRPLVWIYDSMNYGPLLDAMPRGFRVYHATEDYLTVTQGWNLDRQVVADSVVDMLGKVDFVVACTEGVARSCRESGGYRGPMVVAENGCDAAFFLDAARQRPLPARDGRPIAIFQGGINQRLDYPLLHDLVRRMPDWDFHFCGKHVDSPGWSAVSAEPNVHHFGPLQPEAFTARMCDATVALIPYIQDRWIRNSLPLKAFEYVACGLPVVTVPIDALDRNPELFSAATTAEAFESQIREQAHTRWSPSHLEERARHAGANSYDQRFHSMLEEMLAASAASGNLERRLRVVMLYDAMHSMHVKTIAEHVEAFARYSRHAVTYLPATRGYWNRDAADIAGMIDLSVFDVAVVHYSVRVSVNGHLDEGLARALERFDGLKVLYLQDEYEGTEIARNWIERIGFDVVYTCVPDSGLAQVYPPFRFPATEFLPTLTGYVPEAPLLERFAQPLLERPLLIGYRGRKLSAVYGELGQEKYRIGVQMKVIATLRGLPVDIEVDDSRRIYGDAWYEFLGGARATLGTESGANVFDFDGSLKAEIDRIRKLEPEVTYDSLAARVLAPHEGRVQMNQVSPKIFEAIRLRTALVLFEGLYSGVVKADEHFIPLKKDFSNVDEVFAKLQDERFIRELTDRAYRDVVESGRYSYRRFVEGFDRDVAERVLQPVRRLLVQGPLLSVSPDGTLATALPALTAGLATAAHPLGRPPTTRELVERLPAQDRLATALPVPAELAVHAELPVPSIPAEPQAVSPPTPESEAPPATPLPVLAQPSAAYRVTRRIWRLIPSAVRYWIVAAARRGIAIGRSSARNDNAAILAARAVWHLLPSAVRYWIVRILDRH